MEVVDVDIVWLLVNNQKMGAQFLVLVGVIQERLRMLPELPGADEKNAGSTGAYGDTMLTDPGEALA